MFAAIRLIDRVRVPRSTSPVGAAAIDVGAAADGDVAMLDLLKFDLAVLDVLAIKADPDVP
ncbi:hypothetical protein BD626DRAFT_576040 [Schizophyllum amplum]|uniref:Uncharacterized protein n=1 Tax=Schizophyllum amplum TaxID=97359 RepID=A0A550BUG3_9AGAR|nr:hypothetical protein BD626DRAFT_576040 [Auriculariopsis ampla]